MTVDTNGTDSISGPVICTADQTQTEETTGELFTGSCTNDAGLQHRRSSADGQARQDRAVGDAGGHRGTRRRERLVHQQRDRRDDGSDTISGPVTCTREPVTDDRDDRARVQRLLHQQGGTDRHAAALTVKLDKTAPSATLTASGTQGTNGWFLDDVTVKTSGSRHDQRPGHLHAGPVADRRDEPARASTGRAPTRPASSATPRRSSSSSTRRTPRWPSRRPQVGTPRSPRL